MNGKKAPWNGNNDKERTQNEEVIYGKDYVLSNIKDLFKLIGEGAKAN